MNKERIFNLAEDTSDEVQIKLIEIQKISEDPSFCEEFSLYTQQRFFEEGMRLAQKMMLLSGKELEADLDEFEEGINELFGEFNQKLMDSIQSIKRGFKLFFLSMAILAVIGIIIAILAFQGIIPIS